MSPSLPPLIKPLPAGAQARLVAGPSAVHEEVERLADQASSSLTAAVFRIDDPTTMGAIERAGRRTGDLHVLADHDASDGGLSQIQKSGNVATLGTDPSKQHSKGIVVNRTHAMVATDLTDADGRDRMESGVAFSGSAAAAMDAAIRTTSGTPHATQVLTHAAGNGVLINDHESGFLALTMAMRDIISGAGSLGVQHSDRSPLIVSTKAWDDPVSTKLLAKNTTAASRHLITHSIPKDQRRALEKSGVEVTVVSDKKGSDVPELHGTIIATNGAAIIASAYFEDRVLDGSNGRKSREMGVFVDGNIAQEAVELLRPLTSDS